ncbi:MAG: undecaprenyldiphospho-muramoylpentapeptide beta-N-acetylglucosaminyltransferase [Phaeodactylibacter sp.]|uniref:undecaprenyldiphospho-muramoylpentapeptide beta-N-acetylglucosaminyltransferase n=1 Tax=Phaeodactylibacter sp. TaxID=1940289 RepID=UPI0032EAE3A7
MKLKNPEQGVTLDSTVEGRGDNPRSGTPRIIISGGGTGGHIFPAIAIADAIKAMVPEGDIRFVGAKGKMEMEKVPKAGYPIDGLWISGLQRKLTFRNLSFPFKLLSSLWRSRQIIRRFKPHVAVGVGGYASGPLLQVANSMGIPTLLQEQNSFPGITNRLLGGKADKICVAYEGMERFFPAEKLLLTGNPVRAQLQQIQATREEGAKHFGFDPARPILFVFGGSLGASSINAAMAANTEALKARADVQVLWQVGELYEAEYTTCETAELPNVKAKAFIDGMDLAYAMSDVIVARSGALTISELQFAGKPAIFIPSPNVAEDHQSKNAQALVQKDAALMIPDAEVRDRILRDAIFLIDDEERRQALSVNIKKLAQPDAAARIAREVLRLAQSAKQ